MPSIPISNDPTFIHYTAIASQTAFTIPFVFFYDQVSYPNPLLVYLTPSGQQPNDFADILILTTDYTITQNPLTYKGSITLNNPASAGDIITIVRNMNNVRLNYYINGGAFTANAVNTDFESEVLYIQQNTNQIGAFTPKYNWAANPSVPGDVILPILGANQTWVKDPTNTFITTATTGAGGLNWQIITADQTIVPGQGYFVNKGSQLVLTMPSGIALSSAVGVVDFSGNGWKINLSSGQTIRGLDKITTSGGYLESSTPYSTAWIIAESATQLVVYGCTGLLNFQ